MDGYAIEEKLEKGYMHCRVIINMVGKPREHVEKILEKSLEKLNEEKGVEVIEQKSYPGKEQDNFFSAFFRRRAFAEGFCDSEQDMLYLHALLP